MNCEYTYFCRKDYVFNLKQMKYKINFSGTLLKVLFTFLFIYGYASKSVAQVNPEDSSVFAPLVQVSYQAQFPGEDLQDRFGFNNQIGGGFSIKTRSNILFGIKGGFIFGSKVKETDIFGDITSTGYENEPPSMITKEGTQTQIFYDMRGFSLHLTAGKLFNVLAPNPNSGIVLRGGGGFLQHKIRIHWPGSNIPQLDEEYKKGYDRLSSGPAANLYLGYMYLGNDRMINFYLGADLTYARTVNRRGFNYDTMSEDNTVRTDLMYSIQVGWILPLYKPAPKEYYYY